jgi:hypothetical protein
MELLVNAPAPVPPPPQSLEESGLPEDLVAGLVIKMLYQRGWAGGGDLADRLALPFRLLDDLLEQLQDQRLVQVQTTKGPTRGGYVFGLTGEGRRRAVEELEQSRYVGPAPVPFDDFVRSIEFQSSMGARIPQAELLRALDGLVLPDSLLELLGPAVNSGRSLFLYGESGNGKTVLAKRLAEAFGSTYYVPHSVLVDGSIMIVYDPVYHGSGGSDRVMEARTRSGTASNGGNGGSFDPAAIGADAPGMDMGMDGADGAGPEHGFGGVLQEILRTVPEHDRRYVKARRPVVMTGGELTLEQLDLQWDAAGGMYQAPPQVKAAGGVLVIDDLGRQRVQVQELLNRWGVPLEQRQDHLTLRSGRSIVVPFDCFIVFSTNLEPRSLGDDSFMRRIHYKIHVPHPGRDEYERIFRYGCEERGIRFDPAAVDYIFDEFYGDGNVSPRRCHPRDVLDHLRDLATYRGEAPRLDRDLLDLACRSYFLT